MVAELMENAGQDAREQAALLMARNGAILRIAANARLNLTAKDLDVIAVNQDAAHKL